MNERDPVVLGEAPISIADVIAVAARRRPTRLTLNTSVLERWAAGARVVEDRLASGTTTYGVNTGFGAAFGNAIPRALATSLAGNLPRYHGCGVDPPLSPEECRAVLVVRLASLTRGLSGVRPLLLQHLQRLISADIVPVIPSRGSVGASGDLTPLAYIALTLMGEASVYFRDQIVPSRAALSAVDLPPLTLAPKESLAIMNGTSVMTALMCLGYERAARLARLSCTLTAMTIDAIGGQVSHLDERILKSKPHPGQIESAAWMREDLGLGPTPAARPARLQERYSIRCAPHIVGVLLDTLGFAGRLIEIELNGVSDNPLVVPETGEVLHGGNFYGGHVALAADTLKNTVANLADLLERQVVLLNNPTVSGLPANLVGGDEAHRVAHHGFKAMEITASALTAEALKLTMPASVFSRSTEGHNQDKTSMGTIAARDCLAILDLTESVAAVHLLAVCQALSLGRRPMGPGTARTFQTVRAHVPPLTADRPMDDDIRTVRGLLAGGRLC